MADSFRKAVLALLTWALLSVEVCGMIFGGWNIGKPTWRNPYIRSGMVSMWDGEWKNQPGISSPEFDAERWADIVGGHDIPLSNTNSKVFPNWAIYGDKYVDFNPSVYITWGERVNIGKVSAEEITLEIVCGSSYSSDSTFATPITIYCENGGKYMLPYNSNSFYTPNSGGTGFVSIGYEPVILTGLSPKTISYSCRTGMQCVYVDGELYFASNKTWSNAGMLSMFGLYGYNAEKGRLVYRNWCIRLYNRALSSNEVVSNHEVDVKRFKVGLIS